MGNVKKLNNKLLSFFCGENTKSTKLIKLFSLRAFKP